MSDIKITLFDLNLGAFAPTATTLVEKIDNAMGGLFLPWQKCRIAKADAKIALMQTETKIKISGLERRALSRFVKEEAKKQENIEEITRLALPQVEEGARPQDVDDDWIMNFFEKCRIISNENMQRLWAKVLAGEANNPGAFSKRTIGLLSEMSQNDALIFCNLCSFCLDVCGTALFIYPPYKIVYYDNGINESSTKHLHSLGLIHYDLWGGARKDGLPQKFEIKYFDRRIGISFLDNSDHTLDLGVATLTQAGLELFSLCPTSSIDGFIDIVIRNLLVQQQRRQEQGRKFDVLVL